VLADLDRQIAAEGWRQDIGDGRWVRA